MTVYDAEADKLIPKAATELKKTITMPKWAVFVKKNRGVQPERTVSGSRKIIRTILQQLEKEGYIAKATKGIHKGRIITGKGKSFLDKLSK